MGLIKTAAKVAVASSVHGRVQRRQQERWAAQDQAQQAPIPPPTQAQPPVAQMPPPAPTVSTADKISQLKALGELKESGVLSDVEFEIEKRKLLQA